MAKKLKIVFKETKTKGLARIGAGYYLECKLDGKQFAIISGGSVLNPKCRIQIAYQKDGEASWDWFNLKHSCTGKEEAKEHLQKILPLFMEKYKLAFID